MSTMVPPNSGTINGMPLPESKHKVDVQVINGIAERIHTVMVHEFEMTALEDPIIEAGPQLYAWQQSEQGQWVMAHALEAPIWHKQDDIMHYLVKFRITARLRGRDYTYWVMKWNSQ